MTREPARTGEEAPSDTDREFRREVDRILRCREAEDAAKEDTKELYAELKARGYDKAALGALVRELRSKDKDAAKFEEKSAVLDLYRDAYERASHVHAREGQKKSQAKASEDNGSITGGAGAVTGEASRLASGRTGAGEAVSADLPTVPPSQPDSSPDLAATKATGVTLTAPVATPFKLRPHCQNPDRCAGVGKTHCHACTKAMSATLQHEATA